LPGQRRFAADLAQEAAVGRADRRQPDRGVLADNRAAGAGDRGAGVAEGRALCVEDDVFAALGLGE